MANWKYHRLCIVYRYKYIQSCYGENNHLTTDPMSTNTATFFATGKSVDFVFDKALRKLGGNVIQK